VALFSSIFVSVQTRHETSTFGHKMVTSQPETGSSHTGAPLNLFLFLFCFGPHRTWQISILPLQCPTTDWRAASNLSNKHKQAPAPKGRKVPRGYNVPMTAVALLALPLAKVCAKYSSRTRPPGSALGGTLGALDQGERDKVRYLPPREGN
jgi:hypothetical protein